MLLSIRHIPVPHLFRSCTFIPPSLFSKRTIPLFTFVATSVVDSPRIEIDSNITAADHRIDSYTAPHKCCRCSPATYGDGAFKRQSASKRWFGPTRVLARARRAVKTIDTLSITAWWSVQDYRQRYGYRGLGLHPLLQLCFAGFALLLLVGLSANYLVIIQKLPSVCDCHHHQLLLLLYASMFHRQ